MGNKVLHIALSHGGGGVEVYLRLLLKHTSLFEENILICSSDFSNSAFSGIKTTYFVDVPREISFGEDIRAIRKIRKIIRSEKPDIIYCHSSMAGALGRVASIFTKSKIIYNPHGWSFDIKTRSEKSLFFYRMVERFLAIFSKKIVCISDYEKEIALKYHICPNRKLIVIKNGIEIHSFGDEKKFNENEIVIGCAARLSQQKNPLLFAKVMGIVSRKLPSARFIWIGDGDMRQEFETALSENNIKEKTEITGWVSDPYSYIAKTDIGVLLSSWEGFGLSVLDFLMLGKPLITSNVGGIPEIMNEKVGYLVSSENPEEIANKIIEMIEQMKTKSFYDDCINRAREFDIKNTAEATLNLYSILLSGKEGEERCRK